MGEAESLDELTGPLLASLREATGLDSVYLTRIHWEVGEQEVLRTLNQGALEIAEGLKVEWSDTLCRRALLGGPIRTSNVPEDYGDSRAARALGLKTFVTYPVVREDHTIWGTLCGASAQSVAVDDAAMDLMKEAAGAIAGRLEGARDAAAFEAARLREEARAGVAAAVLEESSLTDPATGLHNRRGFAERWQVERDRAMSLQYPVAILLLAVAGGGEGAVRRVATALEKQVRDIDLLARLGREDFVIGLSHADAMVGEHVFNRVRALVATLEFSEGEEPDGISGGIASSSTTPAPDLMDAAERVLREARAAGPNRAQTWHGDLPAESPAG